MKFRKLFFITLLLTILSLQVQAQDIVKYFADMPGYLLPSMESSHKLELIENFENKTANDTVKNLFGGKVRILELDTVNHYISLQSTSVSRFEMKVFERNDTSRFIAVINTVCAPACSSYIKFYDTKWNEIKLEFPSLTNQDWDKLSDESSDPKITETQLKVAFLEYSFDPKHNSVIAKNNGADVLGLEEQKLIKPALDGKLITIKWQNGKWNKI